MQIVSHSTHVIVIALVASAAGLLFGFDTGVISGAQDFLFKTFQVDPKSASGASLAGLVVGAVPMGAVVGAIISGWCADRLSRRTSLRYSALLFIIGSLTAALAPNIDTVIAGRLVMGLAVGVSSMVAPMYLSEVAPPAVRGTLVFLFQLAITIGLVLAFLINFALADSGSWRGMIAAGVLPAAMMFVGLLAVPQSPRWLVSVGRNDEAAQVLRLLLGKDDVQEEVDEIGNSAKREAGGGIRTMLSPRFLPLVMVAFGLFVFQQLSGINAIMYYGPQVFRAAGFGGTSSYEAQFVMGIVNVAATVIGVWLVDRAGRRPLLLGGFVGMIACLVSVGAILGQPSASSAHLSLIMVLLFIAFFAVSLGGVPYVIMSEIFPLQLRGTCMAVASVANWAFNMAVSYSFDPLVNAMGMGNVFFLFGACTAVGFVFAFLLVPETRGTALEQIEANLYAGKPPRHLGDPPALA
ncbi:MAG: sugar porter family MFS transporter [Armatimonadetes bacterium]|nr:sugar porter family MFS transporter [Armatimonadota bacterium]